MIGVNVSSIDGKGNLVLRLKLKKNKIKNCLTQNKFLILLIVLILI